MRYGTGMWRRRTASGRASARSAGFEAAGEGVVSHRVGDRVMGRCDGALSAFDRLPTAKAVMDGNRHGGKRVVTMA